MQETPGSGIDSTDKCSAIIDVSILSTSDEHQKQKPTRSVKTSSKRAGSGTNVSSARRDPLPRFLANELNQLSFQIGENVYRADDTAHTQEWSQFVSEHANIPPGIDWSDLEERTHFLNMLYAHCTARGISFPLAVQDEEKFNEKLNES